jgi:hypothetical protein
VLGFNPTIEKALLLAVAASARKTAMSPALNGAACTFNDWLSKQPAETTKDLRSKDLSFINIVVNRGDLWRLFSRARSFLCDLFVELRVMFQTRHTKPIVIENWDHDHPNDWAIDEP